MILLNITNFKAHLSLSLFYWKTVGWVCVTVNNLDGNL